MIRITQELKSIRMKTKKLLDLDLLVFILPLIMLFGLCSCEDFIEKNISGDEMILIAPGDNMRTSFATQTFWWEDVDGATSYNLQIVSPSFESVGRLIADTIVLKNKFAINLFPGSFEWRVRAQNGSYKTPFVQRNLEIDSTLDLKSQSVFLTYPTDKLFLNSSSIFFIWQKLYNADTYSIEIHKSDWSGELVYSLSSVSDSITVNNITDGDYIWGIRAWNSNSTSQFTKRKFSIDKIVPGIPSLLSPLNKANFTHLPVNLIWTRSTDTGSSLTDSLLVSSDSVFTHSKIVAAKFMQDQELDNAVQDTGVYFWKVKSIDAAKNQGQFSAIRHFKVLNK
jgi:hypothetical protein